MDHILRDTFDEMDFRDQASSTFDYQEGWADAMEECGRVARELRITFLILSLVFLLITVRIIFYKRFR